MISRRTLLLATVASATLLNPLNSSMISVALPSLGDEFGLSFSGVTWLVSIFYLTSAVAQPVVGRLGDLFGKRRVFFCGLALVAASSLLAPFSPGFLWLVLARSLQAIGSSVFFPIGTGLIRDLITERRAAALGVLAVFASTSAAIGPSLGGLLVYGGGWRLLFFVNLPFLVFSAILAAIVLPREPARSGTAGRSLSLDLPGILLFAAALTATLVFLLSLSGDVNLYAALVAPLAWGLFYLQEIRSEEPLINLPRFFSNRGTMLVHAQYVLLNVVFYAIFFGMPTFLQEARGLDARTAGLVMFSVAGLSIFSTSLAGRVIDRRGPAPALILSALTVLSGTLLLFTIGDETGIPWILIVLALFGIGAGFGNLGLQDALLDHTPKEETGAASGLFMTSRYLGTILATSLLGIFFGSAIGVRELHLAALALVVCAATILPLALLTPSRTPVQGGET